jgi:uncharacterized protein YxjI
VAAPNEHDVFELRQRIRLVINQYEFTLPGGDPVCFVEQKRFAFKEDIRFYSDDSKATELMRSTYTLFDAQGNETAKVQERSVPIALIRRFIGLIPFIGGFTDWLPIPYHFDFVRGGQVIGTHVRQAFKFRDTYTIDFSGDPGRTLDRRLVLATAVGLDALQAR